LLHPDVVTMDIQMPGMNGLETLQHIMTQMPTPVVMLSSYSKEGAELTFQALELGAVDFIAKPHPVFSTRIEEIRDQILEKLRTAGRVQVRRLAPEPSLRTERLLKTAGPKPKQPHCVNAVTIGVSAGGPKALIEIIPTLPPDVPAAFLVAQHMPPGYTKALADRLNSLSQIEVKEAKAGDEILHGMVLIAEGGHDLTVAKKGHAYFAALNRDEGASCYRPSIDKMMASTAEHFRERAIGVIMTGMCSDGVLGVRAIKEKQGRVIAQDEETSAVYGMNKLAVQSGVVDRVVPLSRIVPTVIDMLEGLQPERASRPPGPSSGGNLDPEKTGGDEKKRGPRDHQRGKSVEPIPEEAPGPPEAEIRLKKKTGINNNPIPDFRRTPKHHGGILRMEEN